MSVSINRESSFSIFRIWGTSRIKSLYQLEGTMLIQVRKTYKWPLGSLYGGVVEEAEVTYNGLRIWLYNAFNLYIQITKLISLIYNKVRKNLIWVRKVTLDL